MHRSTGETLSLTPQQRERAKEILKQTVNGEVESPVDIVDSWEEPDTTIDRERKEKMFPKREGFIPPEAIAGSVAASNRLEQGRIKKVLAHMLKDNFEVQNSYPPVLQKREDRFYVTSDGHHRCMVAKTIGLEELYTEYTEVPTHLLE